MESLRSFLEVRRTGSITAAAESRHMTQPALGKRIAGLERELGVTLFRRGKGRTQAELTPEGAAFSDIAARMLMLYEQAMELREDAGRRFLTAACIRSAHDALMPELLARLRAAHPELCVTVEDHHTAEIFTLLEDRRVDVGITQSAPASGSLTGELLYEEPYRAVFRGDGGAAPEEAADPAELRAEHGIFQAFDGPFETWFDRWWQPYSVKMRVNTTPTAERYFSEPEDWMIVPEAVARSLERRGFVSRPLRSAPPLHRVYLTVRARDGRESLRWFREAALALAAERGERVTEALHAAL